MSGILGDMGLALIRLSKFEEEGGMELARYTASMESTQAVSFLSNTASNLCS